MDMESTSKMRRHENTSSSEEDDLVDLLGNTYQVKKQAPKRLRNFNSLTRLTIFMVKLREKSKSDFSVCVFFF